MQYTHFDYLVREKKNTLGVTYVRLLKKMFAYKCRYSRYSLLSATYLFDKIKTCILNIYNLKEIIIYLYSSIIKYIKICIMCDTVT